ncbi:hypothetical protein GCM10009601_51470 [Streptomyces thermospinosisporus]|uniref:Uncharacterized protein n=1 Tax=Streptomyces thermospinosisporus TaxID=161482 RepID=A0ABN1Z4Y3_9ACTN
MRTLRTLLRLLVVAAVIAAFAASVAAGVSYLILDGSALDDRQPTRPPTVAQPEPTATPTASIPAKPRPSRWPLNACLDRQLQRIDCTPGALRIVGTVHQPGPTPCADLPETTHTRHAGDTALCLTTRH